MNGASEVKIFKPKFEQERYDEFLKVISESYKNLSFKAKDGISLSQIIKDGAPLQTHLKGEFVSKPESFTQDTVIDPILGFLGYGSKHLTKESRLKGASTTNYPDYKLILNDNLHIFAEAEPLNEDLNLPGKGLNQVYDWLNKKISKTDYGIAVNGFEWVLVQYLVEANKKVVISTINLRPFFLKFLGEDVKESELKKIFTEFDAYFSRKTSDSAISGFIKEQSDKREQISKKFYERYLKIVFGVDKKGNKIFEHSLFDAIKGVDDDEDRKRLAQITINRLIFVKFIESKGWINNNPRFLKELRESFGRAPAPAGFYRTYLEPLFFLALNEHGTNKPHPYENVRYLNGGLFRKGSTESKYPNYDVSNDVLLSVVDFLEEYSFEIKGAEKIEDGEEALDPEILGYIFERTANHEAGAYYTPENITTYISDQTIESLILERVNAYLREKGKQERTNLYTIFGPDGLDIDDLRNLYEKRKILDVKVLDPACGSGAFFIPAIRKLLDLNKKFYVEINRAEPDIYQLQKSIVEKNIYGVDINSEAIEIAKLRLWLDLLDAVEDIDKVDSLPNIEYNVMAGNSLIGAIEIPGDSRAEFYQYYHPVKFEKNLGMYPEFVEECKKLTKSGEQFETTLRDILRLRNKLIAKYREETHPNYAYRLREVIQDMSDVFREDIDKVYFHRILGVSTIEDTDEMKNRLRPFHWGIEFSDVFERGGFDVVVGNPPYIDSEYMAKKMKLERDIYSSIYTTAKGNWDLYIPFYEQAFALTNIQGSIAFITPNKWLSIGYGSELRKSLTEHLSRVCACDDIVVFKEAGNSPVIAFFNKAKTKENIWIDAYTSDYILENRRVTSREILSTNNWGLLVSKNINLLLKIYEQEGALGNLCNVENPFTVSEAYELKKIIYNGEKSTSKDLKLINTGTIDKFVSLWGKKLTTYIKDKYQYPFIKRDAFKELMPRRYDQSISKKIVLSGMRYFEGYLDERGEYVAGKSTILVRDAKEISLESLNSFLNSKLVEFYLKEAYSACGIGGGVNFTPKMVETFPIPMTLKMHEANLGQFNTKICGLLASQDKEITNEHKKEIESLFKKMNEHVYHIYGLTKDEIGIIENYFL